MLHFVLIQKLFCYWQALLITDQLICIFLLIHFSKVPRITCFMYNIELNLMNIYFNAVTCIYSKYLLLNQEYILQRRIKTIGQLLLTPTDFVVGTFGCTVLSLNNTVITSFARCYSIHLHIFHHTAY